MASMHVFSKTYTNLNILFLKCKIYELYLPELFYSKGVRGGRGGRGMVIGRTNRNYERETDEMIGGDKVRK
jgi:hypothetical protein